MPNPIMHKSNEINVAFTGFCTTSTAVMMHREMHEDDHEVLAAARSSA